MDGIPFSTCRVSIWSPVTCVIGQLSGRHIHKASLGRSQDSLLMEIPFTMELVVLESSKESLCDNLKVTVEAHDLLSPIFFVVYSTVLRNTNLQTDPIAF